MTTSKLDSLLRDLRDNVFVKQASVNDIEKRFRAGEITDQDAYRLLRRLDPPHGREPFILTPERVDDEWKALANVIDEAEKRAEKLASRQFLVGLLEVPVFILLVLISLSFGWSEGENSGVLAAVIGACLIAVGAHSFFVLRIHQQASLAAERLSEKRVGMFFLRIALSRESSEDTSALIEAGTAMFLGHQTATTIPLQAADYSATQKP